MSNARAGFETIIRDHCIAGAHSAKGRELVSRHCFNSENVLKLKNAQYYS